MEKVTCPYCGKQAELIDSKEIYVVRSYGMAYLCRCKPELAYVGCHKGTTRPLGRLADGELRFWKKKAHSFFDSIWRQGTMTRKAAYFWLAKNLGIPKNSCHIGMFDVDQCRRVVDICEQYNQSSEVDV